MTDNEIIKALECSSSWHIKNCEGCPLEEEYPNCAEYVTYPALELIKRQKAEIQELYKIINKITSNAIKTAEHAKGVRAEAIKEFAERLKEKQSDVCAGHGLREYVVSVYDIDNLVKEMVGEDK